MEEWTVVAHPNGCNDGTCPTIWENQAGRARIRGADAADPSREVDIEIDASTWAVLKVQLRP